MTQTATFELQRSEKLRKFAKKFERPAPPSKDSGSIPAPRNTIFSDLDVENNVHQDSGPSAIIHVVPDFRYIFMTIAYHVLKLYPSVDQKKHRLITPSTMISYCLYIVYAFLLVSDFHGLPVASFNSKEFMTTTDRIEYMETLLNCFVPPFLLDILHGLADSRDPRRPDLQYFATLAASIFAYDFGRLIPAQIFQISHNLAVTLPANTPANTALAQLFATRLFNTQGGTNNIAVGNYFSAGIPVANQNVFMSFMLQKIIDIVSPITNRSLQQRSFLARIPFTAQTINTANTNPYIIFLNADVTNIFNQQKFMQQMSAIMKAEFDAKFQLGATFDDLGGIQITTHGYSPMALPTWHHQTVPDAANIDLNAESTATEYATNIDFLTPAAYAATGALTQPAAANLMAFLYLTIAGAHNTANSPDIPVTFSEHEHIYPSVRFLSPYVDSISSLAYTMMTGLIIESYEIDGSSVPMPNYRNGLHEDNAQYAQSALPLSLTVPAIHIGNTTPIRPIQRTHTRDIEQKVSIDLYDMAHNRLPQFDADTGDAVPAALPGFTLTQHVSYFARAFSKISFRIGTNPAVSRIPVWSPYRFINNERSTRPLEAQIYILTNLRNLFGTHIPLVESKHPARRLLAI
jgi:hypothetical protein